MMYIVSLSYLRPATGSIRLPKSEYIYTQMIEVEGKEEEKKKVRKGSGEKRRGRGRGSKIKKKRNEKKKRLSRINVPKNLPKCK